MAVVQTASFTGASAGTQLLPGASRGGILHVVNVTANATNTVITIYDNTSASGTILCKWASPANWGNFIDYVDLPFSKGLYAVITGDAGSFCQVTFE